MNISYALPFVISVEPGLNISEKVKVRLNRLCRLMSPQF